MGNLTKKSIISGLVWVRGSLGEDQPTFQVVVNKPITLDQGEQIAMILKQSIDEARAQIAAEKKDTLDASIDRQIEQAESESTSCVDSSCCQNCGSSHHPTGACDGAR